MQKIFLFNIKGLSLLLSKILFIIESLFKNPIIRNLLAIALGVVIIINPQLGPNIVIMLIGATLAIPALLAIIGYFSYKNKETPMVCYGG